MVLDSGLLFGPPYIIIIGYIGLGLCFRYFEY